MPGDLFDLIGLTPDPPRPAHAPNPPAAAPDPTPAEPVNGHEIAALAQDIEATGAQLLRYGPRLFIGTPERLTDALRTRMAGMRPLLLKHAMPWQPPQAVIDAEPCEGKRYNIAALVPPKTPTLIQVLGENHPAIQKWTIPSEFPNLTDVKDLILNFETNGLDWAHGAMPTGMTVGTLDQKVHAYLPFGHRGGGPQFEADSVLQYAKDTFWNKNILNANTKFEVHIARNWGLDLEAQGNTVSDIQHWAALLDDLRRKFNLDKLAADYNIPIEVPRLDERYMADYRSDQAGPRAEYQAILVAKLREKMWPQMESEELLEVKQLEDEVIYPVCEMEKNGAPIDRELLQEWAKDAAEMQAKLLDDVAKTVGFTVNPDSPNDMEKLFWHLDIPITKYTEGGKEKKNVKPSFSDAVLKEIKHPVVQKVRHAGKIASLRSKFLDAYDEVVGDDWILRYHLHQLRNDEHGTNRGRFSASDKNIQQVENADTHKRTFDTDDFYIRRLFIAGYGDFLSADAAQIEFRIFASHAQSPAILAAYAENPEVSFHKVVWNTILPFKPDIDYTKVKSYNFLKIYGGGRNKAAAHLELPRSESDKIVDIYDRMFPEAKTLIKRAEGIAKSRGFVRTVLGRRARFPDDKFAYKALNAVIQGSAADIMKRKLVELHRERHYTNFLMRYTVHDEVCGDALEKHTAERVKEVLNRQSFLQQLKVPILWSVQTGPHWAACK